MGSRGPAPKSAERRQRRNVRPVLAVHQGAHLVEPPKPRRGWLKRTREAWKTWWVSDLAQVAAPTDLPALERMFCLRDEAERALRDYRRGRWAVSAKGQMIVNPFGKMWLALSKEAGALEDRMAGSLRARVQTGLAVAKAQQTMEERNRALKVDWDDDGDQVEIEEVRKA